MSGPYALFVLSIHLLSLALCLIAAGALGLGWGVAVGVSIELCIYAGGRSVARHFNERAPARKGT